MSDFDFETVFSSAFAVGFAHGVHDGGVDSSLPSVRFGIEAALTIALRAVTHRLKSERRISTIFACGYSRGLGAGLEAASHHKGSPGRKARKGHKARKGR